MRPRLRLLPVVGKEQIIYTGFIAQDVETAAKELSFDFSGVDAAKNDKDLYGLRYASFVVPLVKSVQELSKQNEDLQKQIDDLKKIIAGIQNSSVVNKNMGNDIEVFNISLSPNPAQSSTILRINGNTNKVSVFINDVSGKPLWQQQNISSNQIALPIQKLAAGVYMVTASDGENKQVVKLVKE